MQGAPSVGSVLCRLADLADPGAKGFEFRDGEQLFRGFVVRRGLSVYGYIDRCPHAGWPIALDPGRYLTRQGDLILCSGHGALFRLEDGVCVGGTLRRQAVSPLAGPRRRRSGARGVTAASERPLEAGLYVVSTPIGNLGDLTFRALDVLKRCDLILAEDTRVAAKLLNAYGSRKNWSATTIMPASREKRRSSTCWRPARGWLSCRTPERR